MPCAIGAVLPDLIDKPVGFIIFGGVLDNGRIWCHSLLVAAIVLLAGLLAGKVRETPLLVAAAIGILSHQILDLMWRQPRTWYYPLLGPFGGRLPPGHLFTLLMQEISNPSERILAALIAIAIVFALRPGRIAALIHKDPHMVQGILETGAVMLLIPFRSHYRVWDGEAVPAVHRLEQAGRIFHWRYRDRAGSVPALAVAVPPGRSWILTEIKGWYE
jgi:hypothetical protein